MDRSVILMTGIIRSLLGYRSELLRCASSRLPCVKIELIEEFLTPSPTCELVGLGSASGEALNEATNRNVVRSKMVQNYLEGSNVQVADEMVNLIVAQRAYEMNSKAGCPCESNTGYPSAVASIKPSLPILNLKSPFLV